MGIFERIMQQPSVQKPIDPRQAKQAFQDDLKSLKMDPVSYAKAHGKNIPDGMTDPGQIIQYLLNSTQVNNPQYQMALRILSGRH